MLLILSAEDVKKSMSIKQAIEVNANAFKLLTEGKATIPLRVPIQSEFGFNGFMPGYIVDGDEHILGFKSVSVRNDNPSRGLPSVTAQVVLYDPKTSQPLAFMDGTYLTWLRTAAGCGAATKYLARQDVKKLAVFGAGSQAQFNIHAMISVRPSISTVQIYNRTFENAEKLVDLMRKDKSYSGITFSATKEPKEALKNADIIVVATGSPTPLFDGRDIEEGAHLNCVGSYTPNVQEVDSHTIKRSLVVVDQKKAVLEEAGDIVIPLKQGIITEDHALAELGEVVNGKKIRTSDKEITLFKSVGNACQDIATGIAVYKNAKALGLGTEVKNISSNL